MDGHQATLIPYINIGFKNIRLLSDALKGRFDTLQICVAKSSHATASPKALRYKMLPCHTCAVNKLFCAKQRNVTVEVA